MRNHIPTVEIVTPYAADANNGNWRTAHRWQQLLSPQFKVILQSPETVSRTDADITIALHARRSHAAIRAVATSQPRRPLVVVLTGTDLYRDIVASPDAQQSLEMADALIVLQEDAITHVPITHRKKTHVIFQSAHALKHAVKPKDRLNCVVVGHLREEKSPRTIFAATQHLGQQPEDREIHITHIGAPLDKALSDEASALSTTSKHYRWVGALPHGLTRAAIKRAHVLIHPSIMEGGANVIVEAITAGTPVVASYMSGNIGMLGHDYAGYFPVGDADALVTQLRRLRAEPNALLRLHTACQARATLFSPAEEAARLTTLINRLLN